MYKQTLIGILALGMAYSFNLVINLNAEAANKDKKVKVVVAPEVLNYSAIKGKVIDVDGNNLTVLDRDGNTHELSILGYQDLQHLQVESIEKGDVIYVNTRNGKPYAVSKVEEYWHADQGKIFHAAEKTNKTADYIDVDKAHDELQGKVTNLDGSVVKFKTRDGIIHSVNTTGFQNLDELQAETIEVGDVIFVDMRDGKAVAVRKIEETWNLI